MIDEAINLRTENEKELVFLTLLHDNLVDFYEKLGFEFISNGVMVRDERSLVQKQSLDQQIYKGKEILSAGGIVSGQINLFVEQDKARI